MEEREEKGEGECGSHRHEGVGYGVAQAGEEIGDGEHHEHPVPSGG